MLFALLSAHLLLVLTTCANANPTAFRYVPVEDFVAEESHPFESAVPAPKAAPPMEVSDDDQYEQSEPLAVVAVPAAYDFRGFGDLDASATDLQAAATYGGHGGHDHGGWLDMGAYTSGKGAFGWYADFPVGHGGHRR